MTKCTHGDGVTVKIGDIEVDPCIYREVETYYNCTVHILRCERCGHIEIEWTSKDSKEDITE